MASRGLNNQTIQLMVAIGIFLFLYYIFFREGSSVQNPNLKGKNYVYGIMMDAGSSGSRVHIYKFNKKSSEELILQNEVFKMLEPGLSSFEETPKKAADSLKPLLDRAMEVIPKSERKKTPIVLRATAGLRLLKRAGAADSILAEVRKFIRKYPFKFTDDKVSIMGGSDEGIYAWVTVNYLKKQLGQPALQTSGVLDLGGGSTQIAFAIEKSEAKMIPRSFIEERKFGSKSYYLYVHSYLGYGLNSAREKIFEIKNVDEEEQFCIPPKYKGEWKQLAIVGKSDDMTRSELLGHCDAKVTDALFQVDNSKKCPVDRCQIDGVPQPNIAHRDFHAFSFYYDRAIDLGMLKEETLDGANANKPLTPKHYKDAAQNVCPLSVQDIRNRYEVSKKQDEPFQCVDHFYIYRLLHNLGFQDDQKIQLTKYINGYETGWCLGAMIQELMG